MGSQTDREDIHQAHHAYLDDMVEGDTVRTMTDATVYRSAQTGGCS
ncbi:hypothetical protein [Streptomyces sp. NPDC048442]